MSLPIYRLTCQTQSYDWGKVGLESKVATLASNSGVEIDTSKPYAELWMGTHPNAPSLVMDDNHTPLKSLIHNDPKLSSEPVYKQYNGDLPFLFKVLSIRKALSIQAHPDKTLGANLFENFPENYKDANHKPEMAIALTPFEAFCGFRPLEEIIHHFQRYPELATLIGDQTSQSFIATAEDPNASEDKKKQALKSVFGSLMNAKQEDVTEQIAHLISRLDASSDEPIDKLILRLDQQYPGGDVGLMSSLFLNYVVMSPGEAIFLGANEPHAYLSGDCVECMAASDNVVRAGLTPKFKDVKVLVDMLTYRYGSAESQKMNPVPYGAHSHVYDPPIEEFTVLQTTLKADDQEKHLPIQGPSILIVTAGSGEMTGEAIKTESSFTLGEGYVYFIGADCPLNIHAGKDGVTTYRAYTLPTFH
ncbi:phosphomannose isomerase type I [Hesseltinella vesiculosa]|uniref:Mannose-6-phosphate isomerase n=1 Tax=Hesseltinella vesiculosa TaxID=101127 RepID=A0A1X2GNP7_9FUNG|nr:phosphomannose isomerase type I [Hesseltinella vesiculosa]